MLKLPAIPSHVAKVIAYAEGYGEWIVSALIIVAGTVPTHSLSPGLGAALLVANRFLSSASTRLGQFITVTRGAGVGAPVTPKMLADATGDVQAVSTLVAPQVVQDIEKPDAGTIFDQATADASALLGSAAAAAPPAPAAPTDTLTAPPQSAVAPDVPDAPAPAPPANPPAPAA